MTAWLLDTLVTFGHLVTIVVALCLAALVAAWINACVPRGRLRRQDEHTGLLDGLDSLDALKRVVERDEA